MGSDEEDQPYKHESFQFLESRFSPVPHNRNSPPNPPRLNVPQSPSHSPSREKRPSKDVGQSPLPYEEFAQETENEPPHLWRLILYLNGGKRKDSPHVPILIRYKK